MTYQFKFNDDEIMLILRSLMRAAEHANEDRSTQYIALHDRIEAIFEDRA